MLIRGFNPKQYFDKNLAKAIFFLLQKEHFEQQLKNTGKIDFPEKVACQHTFYWFCTSIS